MTIAERLREKGRQEGRLEGHQEGKLEEKKNMAINMLKEGYSAEIIAKIIELSPQEIIELSKSMAH